jgi:hypothetical protein
MARKRFVTSDMSIDEKIAEIAADNPTAALMWPWFITGFDDWGRMEAVPVKIKLSIFPAFPYTPKDIQEAINLYNNHGIVHKYEVDGKEYIAVEPEKYYKYQTYIRGNKREVDGSNYPAPPNPPWGSTGNSEESLATNIQHTVARTYVHVSADERNCIPSPSPSPSPSKEIYICAPDGARTYTAPSPGGSVEAEKVTATLEDKPSKSGPRSPFKSKRQEQLFDDFWAQYPKKRSKGQAEKTWVKIKPDEQLFKAIMAGLERAKTSVEWLKDDGQFIPYPSSWLNAKGWEDEYKTTAEVNNDAKHQRYTSGHYAFGNTKPQRNRFAGLVRDGGTGRIAGQEDSPNTGGDSQATRNFEEGTSSDKGYQVTE